MNRYELLKEYFYKHIEEKCFGIYKQKAYFHSIQVSLLCIQYAKQRHLDPELSAIIGLFHDYSQFINHTSFNHAVMSSEMVEKILQDYLFSEEETSIIVNAIKNHSDKNQTHDAYSELIKDADVMAKHYEDPHYVFKESEQKRIKEDPM